MKGRAEYEAVKEKTLFENESPSSLFPWVSEEGYGKGLIVGKRGIGKTFFIRKLAEEIPLNIYELNKETLNYELFWGSDNPRAIVVDDVHYLLQMMRLGYLKNNPIITESDVLNTLEKINNIAKEEDIKTIFVADYGPSGLYYNFTDETHEKKFLSLLDGCIATPDDPTIFYKYLGRTLEIKNNTLTFRKFITDELSVEMKKEFRMKGVPLVIPSNPSHPRYLYRGLEKRLFMHVYEGEPEIIIDTEYDWQIWSPSKCYEHSDVNGQYIIAQPRELKVLSEELGEISRKSLGINFGDRRIKGRIEEKEGEWVSTVKETCTYSLKDVYTIEKIIDKKHSEIARKKLYKNMLPLARKLLSASSEKEFITFLLEHELSKE